MRMIPRPTASFFAITSSRPKSVPSRPNAARHSASGLTSWPILCRGRAALSPHGPRDDVDTILSYDVFLDAIHDEMAGRRINLLETLARRCRGAGSGA